MTVCITRRLGDAGAKEVTAVQGLDKGLEWD
jgi:hypothetical protein